ncbi:MAG: hypothetical protein AABY83_07840 [Pseudomonadota bacterium]
MKRIIKRIPWAHRCLSLHLVICSSSCVAEDLVAQPNVQQVQHRITFSYDHTTLPHAETMGLLGTAYLVQPLKNFSTGLGIYSAVVGRRGGFFTGGIESEIQSPLWRAWAWRAGLFMGGGGGGAAPQGGGLMMRPHVGLAYRNQAVQYGLSWSRVWFPNGEIDSTQLSLSGAWQYVDVWRAGWLFAAEKNNVPSSVTTQRRQLAMQHQWYFAPSATYRRARATDARATPPIELIGVRWRVDDNAPWIYEWQALGAWGGGADGYAEIAGGIGAKTSMSAWGEGYVLLSAGAAGGGGVDTAGGGIVRTAVGGNLGGRHLRLFAEGGYLSSIEGHYAAYTAAMGLGYVYGTPVAMSTPVAWQALRVRPAMQRYYIDPRATTPVARTVDLVALKLDWFLTSEWYLSGWSSAAFDGGVGGYATGLMGAGWCAYGGANLSITGELALGAAGGGGMAVGAGAVLQPMLNMYYRLDRSWDATLGAGRLQPVAGEFAAWVFDLGVALRFSSPRAPLMAD